eukprot:7386835-Prymnesium_polylepis.2
MHLFLLGGLEPVLRLLSCSTARTLPAFGAAALTRGGVMNADGLAERLDTAQARSAGGDAPPAVAVFKEDAAVQELAFSIMVSRGPRPGSVGEGLAVAERAASRRTRASGRDDGGCNDGAGGSSRSGHHRTRVFRRGRTVPGPSRDLEGLGRLKDKWVRMVQGPCARSPNPAETRSPAATHTLYGMAHQTGWDRPVPSWSRGRNY